MLIDELILQIRSNPADPDIYEFYYCIDCVNFLAAGGLFPPLTKQTAHIGHKMVWLPSQDSFAPTGGHILHWLEQYKVKLTTERYQELRQYASTTNSGNWVWVVKGDEQRAWLAYLQVYLEDLAQTWLNELYPNSRVFS